MSIKQDIMKAVRGQMPERVPWTVYIRLLPQGQAERVLRSQGLGLIYPPQVHPHQYFDSPNVEIVEHTTLEGGRTVRHTYYRTPVGELTDLRRSDYGSGVAGYVADWRLEYMVKQPADYEVLEFMIRDQVFKADFYDVILRAQQELGDDGVVIARVNRVPFQRLWIEYTGIERLCLDLNDHPGLVEGVMEAMMEKDREMWRLVAESPVEMVQCGDNITSDIVGPSLFEKHFLPHYQDLDEVMRPAGKVVMIHWDGRVGPLLNAVNRLPEGMVVEAYTPPPMNKYSVAEVRAAWKGRPIWINFPSEAHLSPPEEVEAVTLEILRQAAPGDGFLLGITENMPANCWQESMVAIGRVLDRYGKCPITV